MKSTILIGSLVLAITGTLLSESSKAQSEVGWLKDVTTSPDTTSVQDFSGRLAPLLLDESAQEITSLEGWKKQRAIVRKRWMDFLGPMPEFKKANYEVIKTESLDRCVRQRIRYECEPGLFVEAYLLFPAGEFGAKSLPGLVALHQTTRSTIDEIAGVAGPEEQHIGIKLARNGFVVICPRCFLWENTTDLTTAVETFKARHPQALGMRKMLYDAVRATDILEKVSAVDPQRIGAVGHSLGAKETLYLAAFDERIKAAVASEGGTAFKSTNWNALWYLGKGIDAEGFRLNHHEVLSLIAPRPFLILAGESGSGAADGLRTWPLVNAAQAVYRLHSETPRLGVLNHGKGHSIPPRVFDQTTEWLTTYLK